MNNAASRARGGPAAILKKGLRVKLVRPNEKKTREKLHITNDYWDFNTFLQMFSSNIHSCSCLFKQRSGRSVAAAAHSCITFMHDSKQRSLSHTVNQALLKGRTFCMEADHRLRDQGPAKGSFVSEDIQHPHSGHERY